MDTPNATMQPLVTDPLTGFGPRGSLIADLTDAAAARDRSRTFAIFDLAGLRDYTELYGRIEGESLLTRLATRLSEALGSSTRYYRPRNDELAVLLDAPLARAEPLLTATVAALNDRFAQFDLAVSFGAATLPDEASDAVAALVLADRRLSLAARTRLPRERRAESRGPRPA